MTAMLDLPDGTVVAQIGSGTILQFGLKWSEPMLNLPQFVAFTDEGLPIYQCGSLPHQLIVLGSDEEFVIGESDYAAWVMIRKRQNVLE